MAGIYIHIPFCKQACHYCDFHFSTQLKHREAMTKAICKELNMRQDEAQEPVAHIYFGGGTPSMLSDGQLATILKTVYSLYHVLDDAEVTLEANPDDLDASRLRSLKALGINRLSIGVQSFYDEDLQQMNRAHSAKEAHALLEALPEVFDNYTLDMIYGIPGMSLERWKQNLATMAQYNPPHFSAYALTIEQGTALAHFIEQGKMPDVSEEESWEHYQYLLQFAKEHQYQNYEFSNFGRPGNFSQNNMAYWDGKSYLGIGPGAHSFDGKQRSWNVSNNPKYIKAIERDQLPKEVELLSATDLYNEYIMTRLRTMWGIDPAVVESRFGASYYSYLNKAVLPLLSAGKLVAQDGNWLIPNEAKFLSDGIASALFYTA